MERVALGIAIGLALAVAGYFGLRLVGRGHGEKIVEGQASVGSLMHKARKLLCEWSRAIRMGIKDNTNEHNVLFLAVWTLYDELHILLAHCQDHAGARKVLERLITVCDKRDEWAEVLARRLTGVEMPYHKRDQDARVAEEAEAVVRADLPVPVTAVLRHARQHWLTWYEASEMATDDGETAVCDAGLALYDRVDAVLAQGRDLGVVAKLAQRFINLHTNRQALLKLLVGCRKRFDTKFLLQRDEELVLALLAVALLHIDFDLDASVDEVFPQLQEMLLLMQQQQQFPADHPAQKLVAEVQTTIKLTRRRRRDLTRAAAL